MKIDLQMLSDEAAAVIEFIDSLDSAHTSRFGEHCERGLAVIRGSFASKLLYAGEPVGSKAWRCPRCGGPFGGRYTCGRCAPTKGAGDASAS